MTARIGYKHQVSATPGLHSLYDWCFQMMWLFSGGPEDPEDDTVMEKHGAEALNSAVNSLMYAIRTEDEEAQQDVAQRMIRIAKPWTIRWWSTSKLTNRKPLVRILKENAHLIDLVWTEEEQALLKTQVERYTALGTSGAGMVHRWWLACFSLGLGDAEDRNDVSGQRQDEGPLDTWGEFSSFRWLRETFLPMVVTAPAEYPESDQDAASRETLLPAERNENSPPGTPPPQRAVLFVSSSWPSSSFEVVANEVFCR